MSDDEKIIEEEAIEDIPVEEESDSQVEDVSEVIAEAKEETELDKEINEDDEESSESSIDSENTEEGDEEEIIPVETKEDNSSGYTKHETVSISELPTRMFVFGGHNSKKYTAVFMSVLIVIVLFGFMDQYTENFVQNEAVSDSGLSHATYMNCVAVVYHNEGSGYDWKYDPDSEKLADCAEKLNVSANWWQEERDAEAQAIIDAAMEAATGNTSGFIWTAAGIATMEQLGANYGQNMSLYGYPSAGDEFTSQHLAIWNAFGADSGGGNDTYESLLPGGNSPFAIFMPFGIVDYAPTGFLWTEAGIASMEVLGASAGQNMSIYGNPEAGDVFTDQHLAVWNGFTASYPNGGNDTFENLLAGGASPFAFYFPQGVVDRAPTGYLWSHAGIGTMSFYATTYFASNMSVYGNPSPGDIFTEEHLGIWNGFAATTSPAEGNDTFDALSQNGNATYNIPTGIIWTVDHWNDNLPTVTNVTVTVDDSANSTTYVCQYVFSDSQNDSDNSTISWYVGSDNVANGSTYSAELGNGSEVSCVVSPFDGVFSNDAVTSNTFVVIATDE